MMKRHNPSDLPRQASDLLDAYRRRHIDRRAFLNGARSLAVGGLAVGAGLEILRSNNARAQTGHEKHAASARVVQQLRNSFTFQISVDVGDIQHGFRVADAALEGGVDIVEMGTPLLKNQGVSNVVPAFRKRYPEALLLADMKTMDGSGGEARIVYQGGANIIDFLALAGVDTAKRACATRDEFRRDNPEIPRLAFADVLLPMQGPATNAGDVALRMLDAGVDSVGVHLQSDARRAAPELIESGYLGDVARAVFDRVGDRAPVQVVGGLSVAQAKRLADDGLRAFVISGNLGVADGVGRYNLPPAEIEGFIAEFIAEVSDA